MNTLRQQINPQMGMVPDPNETFGQYVRELLASSKGFGGPFAHVFEQSPQATPQTSITEGLFSDYLGDKGSDRSGSFGREARESGAPIGSMEGWASANAMNAALNSPMAKAFGVVTGAPMGMMGLAGRVAEGVMGQAALNSIGRNANAFSQAASMPGMGTISDAYGNVSTYSSPATIAAADRAMFGGGSSGGWGGYSSAAAQSAAQSRQAAESRAVAASLGRAGNGGSTGGGGRNSDGSSGPGDSSGRSSGGGTGADGW